MSRCFFVYLKTAVQKQMTSTQKALVELKSAARERNEYSALQTF